MAERWIVRTGTPTAGFRYVSPEGRFVRDQRTLARIHKLRVPPAWKEVRIAREARRAIQAWGFDVRGRKQYRYHAHAVRKGELRKYHRVRQLAKQLPRIRETLRDRSHRRALSEDAVCAIALRLISESLFRPGSDKYARENRSYGMTTMTKNHVRIERGRAVFSYIGKSGKAQRQFVTSEELVRLVARLQRTPGKRLFRYRQGAGWKDLNARTLMAFLRGQVGPFSVKDFRTWGGTLRAATVLAEIGKPRSPTDAKRNVAMAMRIVSSELGNTPAICRASYVHPMVLARYVDAGETITFRRTRRAATADGFAHTPEERALIVFLDRHFPERRRRQRSLVAAAA